MTQQDLNFQAEDLPERVDASAHEVEQEPEKPKATTRVKNYALDKTPQKLKNPSETQVRIRTGAVYIGLTIICVLLGTIPTVLMLAVTAGICAGEFYYMLRADAKMPNEVLGVIAAVLYPVSVWLLGLPGAVYVTVCLVLALLVWYVFWNRARIADVSVCFFGAAYTGLTISSLVVLRGTLDGIFGGLLLFILFLSVWANDAFAYLFGKKFGKHKLAPRVSPKKSWEGFIAGLVFSGLFWCFLVLLPGVNMSVPQAFVYGVVCGVMEVLGDLAESRIKRNVGVKDSGTIMPGHGGLLDRCDSLFLASITAAILLLGTGAITFTF